jgi:hypothetical protein
MDENEELKKEIEAIKKRNEEMKKENKELKTLIPNPVKITFTNHNAIIQILQNPENLVKIIPSSTYSNSCSFRNLLKYDNHSWFSEDKQSSSLMIEFQYHKISLTEYFLRSGSHSFPQNWIFEASKDKFDWKLIDFQKDSKYLAGRYKGSTFNFPKTDFYSYFKLTQVGKSSRDNYYFELTFIELYGEMISS